MQRPATSRTAPWCTKILGSARRITIAIRCWRLCCLLSSSRSRGRRARVHAALKKWRLEAQARHDRARRAHAFLRRPVAAAAAPATARAVRPAERRSEPRRRTFDRSAGGELVETDRWWHAALDELQTMLSQKSREVAAMTERMAMLEARDKHRERRGRDRGDVDACDAVGRRHAVCTRHQRAH